MIISDLEKWITCSPMGIIVMFLPALILTAPIHCRASIADEETNSSTVWIA